MRSKVLFFIYFLAISFLGKAQVKLGNPGPTAPSAILELDSKNRGFLLPRLTTAQRNAIQDPATGLMVYDTDLNQLALRVSATWLFLNPPNATPIMDSLYIPSKPIRIGGNTIGPVGVLNNAFGDGALKYMTSTAQIPDTNAAFKGRLSWQNVAMGWIALGNLKKGGNNTAIGSQSLSDMVYAYENTSIGYRSMAYGDSSHRNTALGTFTLTYNKTGHRNTAAGYASMHNNIKGRNNTAIGQFSLFYNASGNSNTSLGAISMLNFKNGNNNISIGDSSAHNLSTGSYNIIIGSKTPVLDSASTQQLHLAQAIFGKNIYDSTQVQLGIGTRNPMGHRLMVNGNLYASGIISSPNGFNQVSDERLKIKIRPIENAIDKIQRLHGIYFHWNPSLSTIQKDGGRRHVGMLAQEVEKVLPEAVSTRNDDIKTKTVSYGDLVPLLIEALKENVQKVMVLEQALNNLKQEINQLKKGSPK